MFIFSLLKTVKSRFYTGKAKSLRLYFITKTIFVIKLFKDEHALGQNVIMQRRHKLFMLKDSNTPIPVI